MFASISNKFKLNRKETEIKNLCANDKSFLPKLLSDTSSALLQVGLDFTSMSTLAIVCPLLRDFVESAAAGPTINWELRRSIRGLQVGISVCIFVGDGSVRAAQKYHQSLLESKYDFQTIQTNKSADIFTSHYVKELTSNASICIELPEFELGANVILTPSEAAIRKDGERKADLVP